MKKRNVMILVILLVIGFASVSTSLILNGTIGIGANKDDFDVIFTSATINGEGATATIDEATRRTITFTSSKLTNINEKAILDYKVKNNSTQYDADVTINCANDASEYIKVTNTLAGEEITEDFKTTFTAQEEKSGTITAELIKSYTGADTSISVKCTIVANATEKDNAVEPSKSYSWKITEDNDSNGEVSQGDLITFGTESFYIYDIEGDKVKAISQYNLYVGNSCTSRSSSSCTPLEVPTGLQDSRAIGYGETIPYIATVPFTTEEKYNASKEVDGITLKENDYSISTIKEYVDEYANKLKELNADVDVVRLMTKEELESAGCDSSEYSCLAAPEYLYSTSYWTSSPSAIHDIAVWSFDSGDRFAVDNVHRDYSFGVRPVIEISKSLFE